MQKLLWALLLPASLCAISIPKSSLEAVKSDIACQLANAQKQNDQALIKKYQAELDTINQKIKNFELEWLQYRKRQLSLKPTNPSVTADLNEIDKLIQARS